MANSGGETPDGRNVGTKAADEENGDAVTEKAGALLRHILTPKVVALWISILAVIFLLLSVGLWRRSRNP